MDDVLKAQLKLSLEVLSSTLEFMTSPYMVDTMRRFCQDRDFHEALKRLSSSFRSLEQACYGVSRTDIVRRMMSEIKRCSDLGCVRRIVEEYEEMLGLSGTA